MHFIELHTQNRNEFKIIELMRKVASTYINRVANFLVTHNSENCTKWEHTFKLDPLVLKVGFKNLT